MAVNKGGRPKGSADKKKRKPRYPKTPEGYTAKIVKMAIDTTPTERLDYTDVDEMERRFMNYLKYCQSYDIKIGNLAAYNAIGITLQIAERWANDFTNPRRREFIIKVKSICGLVRELMAQDSEINPAIAIFYGKNHDGLKDQTERVTITKDPLGSGASTKELERRYMGSVDIVEPVQIQERSTATPAQPLPTKADLLEPVEPNKKST